MSDVNDFANWRLDAMKKGWRMPRKRWWKRLPIIRHIRYFIIARKVDRHEAQWRGVGAIPNNYDRWVLFGIWHGYERSMSDD